MISNDQMIYSKKLTLNKYYVNLGNYSKYPKLFMLNK